MVKTEVVFKLLKMAKKMDILNQLKGFFQKINVKDKAKLKELQESTGIDFAITVISNIDKAEEEFYEVVASIEDKAPEEVRKQDLDVTVKSLQEIFKSGAFKSFLSLVSK